MEESNAVLEEVVVEVLIQVQQHVQVAVVQSQMVINQLDLQIILFAAVLNQVPSFHKSRREFVLWIIVLDMVYHLFAVPVDQFNTFVLIL